ncbi:hypothetical protein J6590_063869 [Homalodisca vitripennis]|nr:hypothetical protein J6590_063869 [Homalodisca vitripennis]
MEWENRICDNSDAIRRELDIESDGSYNIDNDGHVLDSDGDFFNVEDIFEESMDEDFANCEENCMETTEESFNMSSLVSTPLPDLHGQTNENVHPSNDLHTDEVCSTCKWTHNANFEPRIANFESSSSGFIVTDELGANEWKEIDTFYKIFDYDFVSHISAETNKYYFESTKGVLTEFSKLNIFLFRICYSIDQTLHT